MNKLIIFRSALLPKSETFVISQSKGLTKFDKVFVGLKKVSGGIKIDRPLILNKGGKSGFLKEVIYKLFGTLGSWKMELKKLKPDVIHAHFGPDGYMALPLAKFFKVPLVVTFHGYDATVTGKAVKKSFFMHRVFYQNRKKLFDEASRIIAVSGYIKERVLEMGANPEKVTTHYIGIDIKNFNYFPFEKHDRGILFVGRLTEKKGLKYLIEAYNRLKDDYPYPLTIIGDGPQKEEMQKLAGSNNRIHFLGSMGHDQVIDEIKRAKALCLPSVVASNGDSEGLPIVILEAMALGTPVISTYHSGIPEAITDGSSGFLVEEKNVEGLTQKLNMLTQANDKLVAISKMARQRVENEFSLEIQNRKLEEIYLNEIKSD